MKVTGASNQPIPASPKRVAPAVGSTAATGAARVDSAAFLGIFSR